MNWCEFSDAKYLLKKHKRLWKELIVRDKLQFIRLIYIYGIWGIDYLA